VSVPPAEWTHGLVVFADATELWWLRLLKRGFRHCFVALACPSGWVVVDPLSHRTAIAHFPVSKEFDLAAWYRLHGLEVVAVKNIATHRRVAPFAMCSCVETVKRILGIHARSVLTPWQLYGHLNKTRKYRLTEGDM